MKRLVLYLAALAVLLGSSTALGQERGDYTKQALGIAAQRLYDRQMWEKVLAVKGDTTKARASDDWQNYLSSRLSTENRNQAAEYFASQLVTALQTNARVDGDISSLRKELGQIKTSLVEVKATTGSASTADNALVQDLRGLIAGLRKELDATKQEITELRRMLADVSRNAAVASSHTARYGDRIKANDALADVRNILARK